MVCFFSYTCASRGVAERHHPGAIDKQHATSENAMTKGHPKQAPMSAMDKRLRDAETAAVLKFLRKPRAEKTGPHGHDAKERGQHSRDQ